MRWSNEEMRNQFSLYANFLQRRVGQSEETRMPNEEMRTQFSLSANFLQGRVGQSVLYYRSCCLFINPRLCWPIVSSVSVAMVLQPHHFLDREICLHLDQHDYYGLLHTQIKSYQFFPFLHTNNASDCNFVSCSQYLNILGWPFNML